MCLSEALTCVYFYRSCCNLVCSKSVEKSLESEYKSFQNVETIARNLVKIYNIHDKLIIINWKFYEYWMFICIFVFIFIHRETEI